MYPEYNHVKPDVRLILKMGNFLGFKVFEQESKSENSEILAPLANIRGRKKKHAHNIQNQELPSNQP